jgi:hypothetical protein
MVLPALPHESYAVILNNAKAVSRPKRDRVARGVVPAALAKFAFTKIYFTLPFAV